MNLEEAYEYIKKVWDDQGYCRSCGWHGSLYEHFESFLLNRSELEELIEKGEVNLGCVNPIDNGCRGVYIILEEEKE